MSEMKLNASKMRRAFSLVELVVVVLIVGILAAVAAPKMFDTSTKARESATKASLGVVRNAIELYYSENGTYPESADTLSTDLQKYIKGPFPASACGTKQATVRDGDAADDTTGWVYDSTTGNFWVNDKTNFSKW